MLFLLHTSDTLEVTIAFLSDSTPTYLAHLCLLGPWFLSMTLTLFCKETSSYESKL